MTTRTLALALVALAALATAGEAQQKKIKRDRNLISAEELAELQGHNGYEAVEKLRPDWLRRAERRLTLDSPRMDRGSPSRSGTEEAQGAESPMYADVTASQLKLTVFVDQTEMGSVEELKRLRNDEIREIRFLNGSDAQQRYGPRFAAGVIQVTLKTS
jgi:hypothetical protein